MSSGLHIKFIKALLIFMAMFNSVKWGAHFLQSGYTPLDYNTYYLSAKTYFEKGNPYDSSDRQKTLINCEESFRNSVSKFDPHTTPVYAPQFVWFFKPFLLFDYTLSKYIYFTFSILCLCAIIYWASRLNEDLNPFWAAIAVFAFRGTWFALDNGQPMIPCLAAITAAIYYGRNEKTTVIPGLIIGFFAFKFTLFFAPFAYLFFNKKYKIVITAIVISATLNLISFGLGETGYTNLTESWKYNIGTIWNHSHVTGQFNGLNIINCSSSVILSYYGILPTAVIKPAFIVLLAITWTIFIIYGFRKINDSSVILLGGTLIGLCFSQHLLYDCMVFVVYALLTFRTGKPVSWLIWPNLIVLCFPIGKLAEVSGHQEINFLLPLVLLLNLIFLMKFILTQKIGPTNKLT